jgi:purine catabolism regulator
LKDERGLTVRELAEDAELGLILLSGRRAGAPPRLLDQRVLCVHHSDLKEPEAYLGFGGVLITHGEQLAKGVKAAQAYLFRIAQRQTVALVVGVGEYLDHVDPAVVDYAHGKRMVVFEVPETVSFRTIAAYVSDSLASTEMHRLRRLLAMHEELVRLLIEQRSMGELAARISTILGMAIVLFDNEGHVLATGGRLKRGGLTEGRVWSLYQAHAHDAGPIGVLEAGDATVCLYPVKTRASVERVLAAVPLRREVSEFDEMALSFARQLVALDLLRSRESAAHRARVREGLVRSFLLEERPTEELAFRLRDEGIDLDALWRVVVFAADSPDALRAPSTSANPAEQAGGVAGIVEQAFERQGMSSVALLHEDALIALIFSGSLPGESVHAAVAAVALQLDEICGKVGMVAGASMPRVGVGASGRMLRQAWECVQLARDTRLAGDGVALFDEVGARYRILAGQSRETLVSLSERFVQPLVEYDRAHSTRLLETARALLSHGLSSSETAAALYVHRNTLGKRLSRIEALTGLRLASMDDVMELYVALRAAELTGMDEL